MSLDFGVVLQADPPAARVIDLAKRAESYGFSHAWTFDSHLLWEEPYVIHSAILAATNRITVGPFVTNPATRDWTAPITPDRGRNAFNSSIWAPAGASHRWLG